jgi:hypothetical protein
MYLRRGSVSFGFGRGGINVPNFRNDSYCRRFKFRTCSCNGLRRRSRCPSTSTDLYQGTPASGLELDRLSRWWQRWRYVGGSSKPR